MTEPTPTALYRWFDGDGCLLYVGISCNLLSRTAAHERGAPWFVDARSATLEWFPSREDAQMAEARAIRRESPEANRVLYRGNTKLRTFRIAEDVWAPAAERAAAEGKTMTDVIRAALERYGRTRQRPPTATRADPDRPA